MCFVVEPKKRYDSTLILWRHWKLQKHKERLWCLFELAAFLKSKKMTSGKKALIVRPLFWGPISIAIFALCFVVGLPLTTVSFANYTIDMVLVMTPGLLAGLVVAYPTVACRHFAKQTDFCWIFFFRTGI